MNQLRRHTSGLASRLRHLTLHTHHNLRPIHSIHLQWLVHPSHQEHSSIPLSSGLHQLIRPSFRRPQHNHIINRYKGHTLNNQRAPIPAEHQQTTSPQDITTWTVALSHIKQASRSDKHTLPRAMLPSAPPKRRLIFFEGSTVALHMARTKSLTSRPTLRFAILLCTGSSPS